MYMFFDETMYLRKKKHFFFFFNFSYSDKISNTFTMFILNWKTRSIFSAQQVITTFENSTNRNVLRNLLHRILIKCICIENLLQHT